MNKAIGTFVAAAAALALSSGAYAQNNTLATPSVVSPAAAANTTTSGYGTPGTTNSDSGMSARQQNGANSGATTSAMPAFGVNNTLARPSTVSPAAAQ